MNLTVPLHRRRLIPALALAVLALSAFALPSKALAEPKVLDNAGLKQMLVNMGYEPAERRFSDGVPFFRIKAGTGEQTWHVDVALGRAPLVWVSLNFRQLKDGQKFPYEVLLEALERNFRLDHMRFVYLRDVRKLRLAGSIPNRDVTPADLRKLIAEAVITSQQTQHLWNPNKWRVQAAKEAPQK